MEGSSYITNCVKKGFAHLNHINRGVNCKLKHLFNFYNYVDHCFYIFLQEHYATAMTFVTEPDLKTVVQISGRIANTCQNHHQNL